VAQPPSARTPAAPPPSARTPAAEPSAPAKAEAPLSPPEKRAAANDLPFKDALLAEIRKGKVVFYSTVVAQAQKIEIAGDRVTFTFSNAQRALRDAFDQNRPWLEALAGRVAGRPTGVGSVLQEAAASTAMPEQEAATSEARQADDRKSKLKEQAMADAGVQALLEVFPAEIRDVEEM